MSEDKLAPLGSAFNPIFAHIIRGKLESNDIPCFLFDIETFGAMSHLSLAIGGIRIMVNESNFDQALAIVKEAEEAQKND